MLGHRGTITPVIKFFVVNFSFQKKKKDNKIYFILFFVQRYRLYAISKHYGGMGGGHYVADATHTQSVAGVDAKWLHFNDSSVSDAELRSLVESAAYVLFYRRIDTIAPNEAGTWDVFLWVFFVFLLLM